MDRLDAMAVFMEIAARGSLTRAAESLGRSLPTIVRILATLEAELAVRLFNRTTRRLTITEEGRVYLEHCKRIRAAVADSDEAMRKTHSEPSGRIALTAPVKFGEMHVAPLVAQFLAVYPKVELKLLLLDRLVDLVEEGIDVAIRIAPLEDSTLIARPVGRIRQVVCASPQLLTQVGTPATPQDLSRLPCVQAAGLGDPAIWKFRTERRAVQVSVTGRLTCNSVGAGIAACVAGCGFGRFLCYQVRPAVARGELAMVLTEFEPEPRPLSLVYSKDALQSARLRTIIEFLERGLKSALAKSMPARSLRAD
jgi:DNA-binding transcriptional LysR family regulator